MMIRNAMKYRRLKLGLSQKEVANLTNMTRANYAHIERGRHEPNIKQMEDIATVLKVEPTLDFFKKENNK